MIYVVQQQGREFVKIGFTSRDVASRVAELRTGSVEDLVLLFAMGGSRTDEKRLHRRFAQYRVRRSGEWFRLQGELAAWVAVELQRTEDQRVTERAQSEKKRRAEREAAEREFAERERQAAQERLNQTCAAIAYGRHLVRVGGFKRRLAQRYLPQLERAACATKAEHSLQGPLLPPQESRLGRCRAAWRSQGLPESVGGLVRKYCPSVGCLLWLAILAIVVLLNVAELLFKG